jgi:Uma2 family endonuclease
MSLDITQVTIEYPSSDGEPMAETGIHVLAIYHLLDVLKAYFESDQDVYLAADMFWYWRKGVPADRVAPDVMIIPGASQTPERRSFQSWKENDAIPHTVFEFASEGTWREDLDDKFSLYQQLGVQEYFLFDPEDLYLTPAIQGYRLVDGVYRRMRFRNSVLVSDLGFGVRANGTKLRLTNLSTGRELLTGREQAEANARRAEANARRAEANARRAEANARRAEAEKQRANDLAAEVARLQALLAARDAHGEI